MSLGFSRQPATRRHPWREKGADAAERGRGRGGQRRERPQVFPPLFLAACRAEPIKTFDTGRAGPRAENEKENFCQSRRWSVSLSGGKRTHSDLDLFRSGVLSPILPFTSFSCLPSFPSCSRPSSLSDFVSSEFHMDSQRMKEPNAKGAPKRGRKEKQFLGAPKGGRRRSARKDVRIMAFSSALPCRITATSPTMKRRKRMREGARCHKSLSEARDGAQSVRPSVSVGIFTAPTSGKGGRGRAPTLTSSSS